MDESVKEWSVFRVQQVEDNASGEWMTERLKGVEKAIFFSDRQREEARRHRIRRHKETKCEF